MLELVSGNILNADVEALVNPVNCVGVMGRGLALQFRKAFPANFKAYKAVCDKEELRPGKMLVYALDTLTNPRFIINFPTKIHWKGSSRLEYIEQGLEALVAEVRRLGIHSIALPPLGCGLGGLNWQEVRPRIEKAFSDLPNVRVLLHEPMGAPVAEEMAREAKIPNMTLSRAIMVELIQRYLAALMDTSVTLLEIHKLMYFMQAAGESLKLRYNKATYGPYAENLRHALTAIEGHFITGYGDAEDNPTRQIELVQSIVSQAERVVGENAETNERLGKVSDLISGFETPFGMELLSTVHWVAVHDGAMTVEEAITQVYAWNTHKRMFQKRQIRLAWEVLVGKDWLAKEPAA